MMKELHSIKEECGDAREKWTHFQNDFDDEFRHATSALIARIHRHGQDVILLGGQPSEQRPQVCLSIFSGVGGAHDQQNDTSLSGLVVQVSKTQKE